MPGAYLLMTRYRECADGNSAVRTSNSASTTNLAVPDLAEAVRQAREELAGDLRNSVEEKMVEHAEHAHA